MLNLLVAPLIGFAVLCAICAIEGLARFFHRRDLDRKMADPNCVKTVYRKGDILIALKSDWGVTKGRAYQVYGTEADWFLVCNDFAKRKYYTDGPMWELAP